MQEYEFLKLVDRTLSLIAQSLEKVSTKHIIDVELYNNALDIVTEQGVYLLMPHLVQKEIWLSSPISGPSHFFFLDGRWKSKRYQDLFFLLEQELNTKFDQ